MMNRDEYNLRDNYFDIGFFMVDENGNLVKPSKEVFILNYQVKN